MTKTEVGATERVAQAGGTKAEEATGEEDEDVTQEEGTGILLVSEEQLRR